MDLSKYIKKSPTDLPKYIINFDELTDGLKKMLLDLVNSELDEKYPQLNTNNIEAILEEIKELIPSVKYAGLKKKIEDFILFKHKGIQKIEGKLLDIPPIIKENKVTFKFDKDVFLTGLHFNQTGWKKQDVYSLEINKNKIIDNISTKEIGEHRYFNTYFKVNANTPISFILQNNSGNSRQVMVDLEYLEAAKVIPWTPLVPAILIPQPGVPGIEDIKNDWDICVIMQWEKGTTDVDLHGIIDDMHVCYLNKEYEGFYLNFDFTEHVSNCSPEIMSVKGYKDKKLEVCIQNFNGVALTQPVNIKIYNKQPKGNSLLKEINITLSNDKFFKSVCTIDLNTLKIT